MARKRKQGGKTNNGAMPVMRPDAAGIDIGATEIFVAVPVDRAAENVRSFPTFTQDLYVLADWLEACKIKTVAMESTGVYWIPLFQILEERGFEVCLVNARHVKNVPGRRTDVCDCQWLQFLHSVGLLKASYRPAQEVCAVRSLLRHRESLVRMAATHVNHMQKAMDQMNLQLHHVISDIVGQTGLAIVDAILASRLPRQRVNRRSRRSSSPRMGFSGQSCGESGALTSPRSSVSAPASRRLCSARSDQISPNSEVPRRSLRGWDCARTTTSAVGRCSSSRRVR